MKNNNMDAQLQLDLFHVQKAYEEAETPLTNDELYQRVAKLAGISERQLNERSEIGKARAKRSKIQRKIRWYQQSLRCLNLIEKVDGQRGVWALANKNKKGLHEADQNVKLLAYSTNLGVAIWSDNYSLFSGLNEPIHLCLTSPPYPLRAQRSYGNVDEQAWVDFITRALEPIVVNLVPGGSIVLNISNDIFETKRPSRSLYIERMVLALHDRLGLSLMDRIPWVNTSKPPAPTYWACVNRFQLCSSWEPIFWFTNDPLKVRSDNTRVLEPHTGRQQQLMNSGGENRTAVYGDGAYQIRQKSFSRVTEGKIPKNVLQRGHRCTDTQESRKLAQQMGVPAHPAMFPTSIPGFFIEFLTKEGELVIDPFSGSNKTGLAAERLGRRWLSCDYILEYLRGQAEMFRQFPGFSLNPCLTE